MSLRVSETVTENYFRCDLEFFEVAKEEVKNAHSPEEGAKVQKVIDAVMLESNTRIAAATERLKTVRCISAQAPACASRQALNLA